MNKKLISSVQVDLKDLSTIQENRNIKITGEEGAEFSVNVIKINGTGQESYFNFSNKTFTNSFNSENNLIGKLSSSFFLTTINFPADTTGDVYKILVIPQANSAFKNGSAVYSKNITQAGQTTVALELDEGTEVNSVLENYYTSNPPDTGVVSTGSTTNTKPTNVNASFTITNANHDTYGFGLKLPNLASSFSIPDTYFYTGVLKTVNGSTSSSDAVELDDVQNLKIGMEVGYAASSISGTPVITNIDGNTVILSVAQSFSDNEQIQFRAYGPSLIRSAFGYSPEFKNFIAKGRPVTTTVRTNTTLPASNSEVTIPVVGTRGIAVGTRFEGFNVNTAGNNNLIGQVSASETEGSITISAFAGGAADVVAETVTIGTELNIIGSHKIIDINGTVVISKYPEATIKLMLDLNKFITVGAGS